MSTFLIGRSGENKAVKFLEKNGYNIIKKNYHAANGEIDIIAKKGERLSFVEVKTRTEGAMLPPSSAVNSHKEKNIEGSALIYINRYKVKKQPRYDIIEIIVSGNKVLSLNHIEGAF